MAEISETDCLTLGNFPNAPANSWKEKLTQQDRDAFIKTHRFLRDVAETIASEFDNYTPLTTAGFNEKSGIRNQRPKDLWCSLTNSNSADHFMGMPQIYMIASGRGIEIGFAAAIHRGDFSDGNVKKKLRMVAPILFNLFPAPDELVIKDLQANLEKNEGWYFKEKTRLEADTSGFNNLEELLLNIRTPQGQLRGAASIAKYFKPNDLNSGTLSLFDEFRNAVHLFDPLMKYISGKYSYGLDRLEILDELNKNGSAKSFEEEYTFNPEDYNSARIKILTSITRRQGQAEFRSKLLEAYDKQCAVTGCRTVQALEAAHIYPYNGPETNCITNGILLRSDIHTLFDLGLITIDEDFILHTGPEIQDPSYKALDGKKISLPKLEAQQPSIQSISHRNRKDVA